MLNYSFNSNECCEVLYVQQQKSYSWDPFFAHRSYPWVCVQAQLDNHGQQYCSRSRIGIRDLQFQTLLVVSFWLTLVRCGPHVYQTCAHEWQHLVLHSGKYNEAKPSSQVSCHPSEIIDLCRFCNSNLIGSTYVFGDVHRELGMIVHEMPFCTILQPLQTEIAYVHC